MTVWENIILNKCHSFNQTAQEKMAAVHLVVEVFSGLSCLHKTSDAANELSVAPRAAINGIFLPLQTDTPLR